MLLQFSLLSSVASSLNTNLLAGLMKKGGL
jgi:hypothetical protein